MSGTKAGGKLAAQKNLARDPGFYNRIGVIGGKNSNNSGFGAGETGRALARRAGVLGGRISKRRPGRSKMTDADRDFEASL